MGNRSKNKPAKRQGAAPNNLRAAFRSMQYSGPIPMSSEMEKYEALCPGATDRILTIAEKSLTQSSEQAQHRQNLETSAVRATNFRSILGVVAATVIALASLLLAGFCVYCDHELTGAFFGTGGLGSIVTTFIYGTRSNRQEREAKLEKALQAQNEFSRH